MKKKKKKKKTHLNDFPPPPLFFFPFNIYISPSPPYLSVIFVFLLFPPHNLSLSPSLSPPLHSILSFSLFFVIETDSYSFFFFIPTRTQYDGLASASSPTLFYPIFVTLKRERKPRKKNGVSERDTYLLGPATYLLLFRPQKPSKLHPDHLAEALKMVVVSI
uniref:Uncharacterized protein n=1 Tax=Cacopsylla melanoneura TaxID=428564 RepID=A0A8D8VUB0_9HEMI